MKNTVLYHTREFREENDQKKDGSCQVKHNLQSVVEYATQDEALYGSQSTLYSFQEEQAALLRPIM